jgi:hypothetical protein
MASRFIASLALVLVMSSVAEVAEAQTLSNQSFQLQYDASGIRSLKRTNDVHDTDYIAANGALGRLLIRYRAAPNGDWRELREMVPRTVPAGNRTIGYSLGTWQPTLAARSTGGAAVGAAGVRALNDGVVPSAPAGGGRGGGPGARAGGPGAGGPPIDAPLFTWAGSRGATQWVQYTFPGEETVSKTEVFWTTPPQSWRLLYQDGSQWKDVAARGPYALDVNAFTAVEFAPVKTMAMRLEVTMAPAATVALAEWRVGPDPVLASPPDLQVQQAFTLDGEALDWTVTLTNDAARPVEIGDLAVPFNFAERTGARGDIYTRKLLGTPTSVATGRGCIGSAATARDRISS